MILNTDEVRVGALEGIEIGDFRIWRDVVRSDLEIKGLFKIPANSQESSSSETDFWPVLNETFDVVIPEELVLI